MPDRAAQPEAPATEFEVTGAMIDAGVAAFFDEKDSQWETPMMGEVRRVLTQVYKAMASARP